MPDNFEFPFPTDLYYKDKEGNYIPFNLEDFVTVIKPDGLFTELLDDMMKKIDQIEENIETLDEYKMPSYEISLEKAGENYMVFATIYPNTDKQDVFCVYHSKDENDARGAYTLYVTMFMMGKIHQLRDCVTGMEAEVLFGEEEEIEEE